MAFVRTKVREGRTYYQLVYNYREAGRHRQKVLCHLGKHSSLESAIEASRREEAQLRNKSAELFRKTTEMKQTIFDRYGGIIGRDIPSPVEAEAIEEKARESLAEYEDLPFEHPEHHTRWRVVVKTWGLSSTVSQYHRTMRDAIWYDDRANKVQEKQDKLKKEYPHR